jgi:hypothetical protein
MKKRMKAKYIAPACVVVPMEVLSLMNTTFHAKPNNMWGWQDDPNSGTSESTTPGSSSFSEDYGDLWGNSDKPPVVK